MLDTIVLTILYTLLIGVLLFLLPRVFGTSCIEIEMTSDKLKIKWRHPFQALKCDEIPMSYVITCKAYNKFWEKYFTVSLRNSSTIVFIQQYKWMKLRKDDFEEAKVAISNAIEQYQTTHINDFPANASNLPKIELVNKPMQINPWVVLLCSLVAYTMFCLSILAIVLPGYGLSFHLKLTYAGIVIMMGLALIFGNKKRKKKRKRKQS